MRPPPPQILDFPGDFGFWISDFGFRILDFGFWISDFGFWILGPYVALCKFWISDFRFWILVFGFWISDFGFWFGGVFADIFWMLHKIRITVHADPGRRIPLFVGYDPLFLNPLSPLKTGRCHRPYFAFPRRRGTVCGGFGVGLHSCHHER